MAAWKAAAALSLLAALSGCGDGQSEVKTAAARQDIAGASVPTVTSPPSAESVEDAFPGGRMNVAVPPEVADGGYMLLSDMAPGDGKPGKEIAPVYDKDGHQIGYFATQIGWLSREVVEAPGFDLKAAQDAHLRSIGVDPSTVGPFDPARRNSKIR